MRIPAESLQLLKINHTKKREFCMKIYHGDLQDISNYKSHSYLQINSCGIQSPSSISQITYRQEGRCDYHIIYIIDGQCEAEYDGQTHLLKEGFVLYPPHSPQKYRDYENTTRIWLHFNGYHMEEILTEACLKSGVYHIASPILEKMLLQLIAEHNLNSHVSNEKGLLLSTLYTMGKLANNTDTINAKISDAIAFITTHYNTDISIRELALSCNISQSHFMSLFKKQTGMAPHAYQQTLRLKNAMTLLTSTQLSISDICTLCGYQDPLYFSRLFHKNTGISPSDYRLKHKKSNLFL